MRRYLTETLAVNSYTIASRLKLIEGLNQIVCSHSQTKQMFPILSYDITYDEVLCVYVLNVPKVSTGKGSSTILNINGLLLFVTILFSFVFQV